MQQQVGDLEADLEPGHDVLGTIGSTPLPEKVVGFPGMLLQINLDSGWADFGEDDLKQVNNNLRAGSKMFPISSRGAMYMIDFTDTNNIKQTNPTTRKVRNLRLSPDPNYNAEQQALLEQQRKLLEQVEKEKQQRALQEQEKQRALQEQAEKNKQRDLQEQAQKERQNVEGKAQRDSSRVSNGSNRDSRRSSGSEEGMSTAPGDANTTPMFMQGQQRLPDSAQPKPNMMQSAMPKAAMPNMMQSAKPKSAMPKMMQSGLPKSAMPNMMQSAMPNVMQAMPNMMQSATTEACAEQIFVQGVALEPRANGLYFKPPLLPTTKQIGRPIYRHSNGLYLYYWYEEHNWKIGHDYNFPDAVVISKPYEETICPTMASLWLEAHGGDVLNEGSAISVVEAKNRRITPNGAAPKTGSIIPSAMAALPHAMRPISAPTLASSLVSPWSPPTAGDFSAPQPLLPHVAEIDRHVEELLEKRHAQRAHARHGHTQSSSYHNTWRGRFDEATREACWAVTQVMACCSASAQIANAPRSASACRCAGVEEDDYHPDIHQLPGVSSIAPQDLVDHVVHHDMHMEPLVNQEAFDSHHDHES